MIPELIFHYVGMGMLGGGAYILIAKLWNDKAEIARRLALGAIVGFLIYAGNFPNSLTAFGLGYFSIDAIEAIANKVKPKPSG